MKTKHSQTTKNDRRKIIIRNKIGKQIQKRNKSFAYCRIDKNNDINERKTKKKQNQNQRTERKRQTQK